jgi:maleylacetate reductase
MRDFVHQRPACRVVFGAGRLDRLPAEVAALELRRVLVIAGGAAARHGERVAARLGARAVGRFDRVAQHVPEQLAAEAVETAKAVRADGLCSVGGGSATGLAKAVAVALDLPIVTVPTTYAGSEATAVYGITGERKRTAADPRARVRTVVYDPTLTLGLPARATAASGFNALAHAVAGLTAPAADPMAALAAGEAVRLIRRALPVAVREPGRLDARGELLWAAWLAASSLPAAGGGLHHRLCHVLGGRYGLVHAEVHAVLLPHTVAALSGAGANRGAEATDLASRDRTLALAAAGPVLGDDPAAALRALAAEVGIPAGLAALGMPADKLDSAAAEAATVVAPDHPRHGDAGWFRTLLSDAYHPKETS